MSQDNDLREVRRDDVVATVVIAAHNAERTLLRQLSALAWQVDAPAFEVIVVANRCTDRTVELAQSISSTLNRLQVVHADEKASAAYARNTGSKYAGGEFLLFCDADDCVNPHWVRALALIFHESGVR